MIVTIFRHGEAGRAVTDKLRELTSKGEDDVGFGCTRFHEICHRRDIPHPQLIVHSPWTRTAQTADIIASAFSHATLRPEAALQPGAAPADVDALLTLLTADTGEPTHLLLVSHQPLVSELIDHYLGDDGRVPSLPPGGLATLQLELPEPGCGELLFWALPPEYEASL